MVAGLLDITTGKMCLGEENYLPREHVIAFVPQNYGLLPWQTAQKAVEQNIKISQKKTPAHSKRPGKNFPII